MATPVTVLFGLCFLLYCSISVGLPKLPVYAETESTKRANELEVRTADTGYQLGREMTSEQLEAQIRDTDVIYRWQLMFYEVKSALIAANAIEFDQKFALLEEITDLEETSKPAPVLEYRSQQMLDLYMTVIELDLQSLRLNHFGKALELLNTETLSANDLSVYRAAYFFYNGDIDELKSLLDSNQITKETDEAYCMLLYGRATESEFWVQNVIDTLQPILDKLKGAGLEKGRIALHLAEAYKILIKKNYAKALLTNSLSKGLEAARLARFNLELLKSPAYFGRAHRLTAELMDGVYLNIDSESFHLPSKKIERDHAFEIGQQYQ